VIFLLFFTVSGCHESLMAARVYADDFGFIDVQVALDFRKDETIDILVISRLASLEIQGFGSV